MSGKMRNFAPMKMLHTLLTAATVALTASHSQAADTSALTSEPTSLPATVATTQPATGVTQPAANATTSKESESHIDYMPKIHGVIRSRWEGEFNDGEFGQRFEVRNARVSVEGNILKDLTYYIRIDACNQGKMQFLDAYARWGFAKSWKVQAGQFRVPYGVDVFRTPGGYYFSNRSFIGKYMLAMREVGAKIGYYGTAKLPLTVEAGVFNSASTSNHDVWQHDMNFAAKASYRVKNVTFTTGFVSVRPDSVRMNGTDEAITWTHDRWIVEGEYQYKHYEANMHKAAHAWNLFASYALPLRKSVFNELSFQGRFDGMTDHSTGTRNSTGKLITNNPARNRVTIGSTLAYKQKGLKGAIRLSYEKYFYQHNVAAPTGEGDKITAELIVKF
jgi:hypothetical protein